MNKAKYIDSLSKGERAYLECALWSSTDDDGHPLDDNRDAFDFALVDAIAMVTEFRAFVSQNRADIGTHEEQAGHDLWLSRNGHGAGFFDREDVYGEAQAERLQEAARKWGEVNLYVRCGLVQID